MRAGRPGRTGRAWSGGGVHTHTHKHRDTDVPDLFLEPMEELVPLGRLVVGTVLSLILPEVSGIVFRHATDDELPTVDVPRAVGVKEAEERQGLLVVDFDAWGWGWG